MPNWSTVLREVDKALDHKIKQYMDEMCEITGRNLIVYYSTWQDKRIINSNPGIIEGDRNGFMNCISGMDITKGLDIIIHTPGGELQATQSIVKYLWATFNKDIRVFVPHTAMSAGTMISCASKEIFMGNYSTLGPVDPQIMGTPAHEILSIFKEMKDDLNLGNNILYWQNRMKSLPPQLDGVCQSTVKFSKTLVKEWLMGNMFDGDEIKADRTTDYLSDYTLHNSHGNKLHLSDLKENTDLNIQALEEHKDLQDCVLSIYHCFTILAQRTSIEVIIMNNEESKFIRNHR